MDTFETVKISGVRKETPTVNTLVLDKRSCRMEYGQFYMLWIPGVGEKPYACSGANEKSMEITVKHAGPFSGKLQNLKKGDLIGIRGPYGKGYFTPKGKNPCYVAGGLGIVPMISLLEGTKGKKATVILGAKTKEEII